MAVKRYSPLKYPVEVPAIYILEQFGPVPVDKPPGFIFDCKGQPWIIQRDGTNVFKYDYSADEFLSAKPWSFGDQQLSGVGILSGKAIDMRLDTNNAKQYIVAGGPAVVPSAFTASEVIFQAESTSGINEIRIGMPGSNIPNIRINLASGQKFITGGPSIISDGSGKYLQLPKLTTAQRDALTAVNGMMIYNSDTDQFEGYEAGTWGASLGISKLSELEIDADKDWNGMSITNINNLSMTGKLTVGGAIDPTELDMPDDAPIYLDTAKTISLMYNTVAGRIELATPGYPPFFITTDVILDAGRGLEIPNGGLCLGDDNGMLLDTARRTNFEYNSGTGRVELKRTPTPVDFALPTGNLILDTGDITLTAGSISLSDDAPIYLDTAKTKSLEWDSANSRFTFNDAVRIDTIVDLGEITDTDGKIKIGFQEKFINPVNYININNSNSGNAPEVEVDGDDTNIDLKLSPKGTGSVNASSKKIINVADPELGTDAATKDYADTKVCNRVMTFAPADMEGDGGALGGLLTDGIARARQVGGNGVSNQYIAIRPPSFYTGGNITTKIVYKPSAAPIVGEKVKWFLDYYYVSEGENIATKATTQITKIHTFVAGEGVDEQLTDVLPTFNPGSPPNDTSILYMRVRRDGLDADDTYVNIVHLEAVVVVFP